MVLRKSRKMGLEKCYRRLIKSLNLIHGMKLGRLIMRKSVYKGRDCEGIAILI